MGTPGELPESRAGSRFPAASTPMTRAALGYRHHGEHRVVVEMQECTGDPIERLESEDAGVIAYLRGLESDLDLT